MNVDVDPSAFVDTAPATLFGANLGKVHFSDTADPDWVARVLEIGFTSVRLHTYNDGNRWSGWSTRKQNAIDLGLPVIVQLGSSPLVAGSNSSRVLDPTNVVSKPDGGSFGFAGGRSPQEHLDSITELIDSNVDVLAAEFVNEPGRIAPTGWWSVSGYAFEWAAALHRVYADVITGTYPDIRTLMMAATAQYSLDPWVGRAFGDGPFVSGGTWPHATSQLLHASGASNHQYTKAGGTGRQERINAMLFDANDDDLARLWATTNRWRQALDDRGGTDKILAWTELGGDDSELVGGVAGQNGGWFCLFAELVAAVILSRFRADWNLEHAMLHTIAPGGGGDMIGAAPGFAHTVRSQGLKHIMGPYLKARRRLDTTLTGLGSTPATALDNAVQNGIADARVSDDGLTTYLLCCNLDGSSTTPLVVDLGFTPTGAISRQVVDDNYTSATVPPTLSSFTAGAGGTWSHSLAAHQAVLYTIPSNFPALGEGGELPPPPSPEPQKYGWRL